MFGVEAGELLSLRTPVQHHHGPTAKPASMFPGYQPSHKCQTVMGLEASHGWFYQLGDLGGFLQRLPMVRVGGLQIQGPQAARLKWTLGRDHRAAAVTGDDRGRHHRARNG